MSKTLRMLMVEDSEADSLLLLRELRRGGYEIEYERVETARAMRDALDRRVWDLIVSDYSMPQFSAPDALAVLKEKGLDLPFLIVSGTIGEEKAVTAMLAGAHDFISKDNPARLIPAIERELGDAAVRQARHKSEAALRNSEERYRLIFESSPLPLWVYDLKTLAFLAVNDAAIRHYGYSQSEFLGMTLTDITLEPIGTEEQQIWQQRKKDGTIIDAEITFHDLIFESREARLVLSNDITERKRAEERLHRYNERLRILQAIDQGILTAQSPESVCQFALDFIVSQMPVQDANITIFDLEGQVAFVVASDSRDPKIISAKNPEILILNKAGSAQAVAAETNKASANSSTTIPLVAQGKQIGLLKLVPVQPHVFTQEQMETVYEVTDQLAIAIQQAHFSEQIQRHAAELEQRVIERTAELQRAKERVEAILNNSSDAIVLASFDGVIQQVNPAFDELFRYPPGELIEQSLLTLVYPDEMDILLAALDQVVNTGKSSRVEITCLRADKTRFDADIALAAIISDNAIQSLVCGLRDITEHKQMEQNLRTALEQEKELNELKSRFTSMVSHEFRTPLAVILSSAGLMRRYYDRMDEGKRHQHLHQIQSQVERLVGLLDDVLTLSRAESVEVIVSGEMFDIQALCDDIIGEIQQTSRKHQVEFSIIGDPRMVLMDKKLIRQAVTNLLSNAVKYSPDGGTVNLDLIYEEDQIVFHIKDYGIGIPQADQKHLFESFHRARNVGNISGTGLGLPIVKRAVEIHGGTVSFVSEAGEGTTFTIQIPTPYYNGEGT